MSEKSVTGPDRWAPLEVRHLRAFVAVAEAGSFVGAARLLGYSQPAISHQVLALERIAGVPLLLRSAGGRSPLKLTEAGTVLLPRVRELLRQTSLMSTEVERLANGDRATLSLVTIESLGARILPGVLGQFRDEHPDVQVRVVGASSAEGTWADVESGEADFAFTIPPRLAGPFEVRLIFAEPYVLLSERRDPIRELNELEGKRLVGIRCRSCLSIERHLLAEGIAPAAIERFDDLRLIQALVSAGEAVAIVPSLCVNRPPRGVSVQLVTEIEPREIVALRLRDRPLTSPHARFMQLVDDACAALASAEPTLA